MVSSLPNIFFNSIRFIFHVLTKRKSKYKKNWKTWDVCVCGLVDEDRDIQSIDKVRNWETNGQDSIFNTCPGLTNVIPQNPIFSSLGLANIFKTIRKNFHENSGLPEVASPCLPWSALAEQLHDPT